MTSRTFAPQMISQGSGSRITVELTGRREFIHPSSLHFTLPPLASNDLFDGP
jgi:hypothetical protein